MSDRLAPSPRSAVVRQRSSLWSDRTGATTVTYAVILPILVLVLFGAFAVWRVMAVQVSLRLGAQKAKAEISRSARFLPPDRGAWQTEATRIARVLIEDDLSRNQLVGSYDALQVSVAPPQQPDCVVEPSVDEALFTVDVVLPLSWPVRVPYLLPTTLTLSTRRTGVLQCPHWEPPQERGF